MLAARSLREEVRPQGSEFGEEGVRASMHLSKPRGRGPQKVVGLGQAWMHRTTEQIAKPTCLSHHPLPCSSGWASHPLHLPCWGRKAMLGLKEGQAAKTLLRPGSDDDRGYAGKEAGVEKGRERRTGWERGGEGQREERGREGEGGKEEGTGGVGGGEEEGLGMEPLFTLSKGRREMQTQPLTNQASSSN